MKFNTAIRKGIRYVKNDKSYYLEYNPTPVNRLVKPYCGCALADAICGADETLDLAEKFIEGDHLYCQDKALANLLLEAGVVGVDAPVTRQEAPEIVRDTFCARWEPAYEIVDRLHQRGWSPTKIADWLRSIGL